MSVVADSSPLIILAKLRCFELLNRIYPRVFISTQVYHEVVVLGTGLAGSSEVSGARWIEVKQLRRISLPGTGEERLLGLGELSTILLAKELGANTVLLDDFKARKLASAEGLRVSGSVGLLETFHVRGYLSDLRNVFRQLKENSYIDGAVLNARLKALGLPPL